MIQTSSTCRAERECFTVHAAMQSLGSSSGPGRLTCSRQHDGCLRSVLPQHRCCSQKSRRKHCLALRFKQQGGCGNCRKRVPAAMALPAIVPSTASQPFGVWAALALAGAAGAVPAQLPDVPFMPAVTWRHPVQAYILRTSG